MPQSWSSFTNRFDHVTLLLQTFRWNPITICVSYKLLITAHKALGHVAPVTFSDLLSFCSVLDEARLFLIYKPLYDVLFPLAGASYSLFFPELAPSPSCLILNVTPQKVFLSPHYVNRSSHNSLLLHSVFLTAHSMLWVYIYLLALLFSSSPSKEWCQKGVKFLSYWRCSGNGGLRQPERWKIVARLAFKILNV